MILRKSIVFNKLIHIALRYHSHGAYALLFGRSSLVFIGQGAQLVLHGAGENTIACGCSESIAGNGREVGPLMLHPGVGAVSFTHAVEDDSSTLSKIIALDDLGCAFVAGAVGDADAAVDGVIADGIVGSACLADMESYHRYLRPD